MADPSLYERLGGVFAIAGLFWNPFLLFIALFVWIGAAAESSMAQMRAALAGLPVRKAMLVDFATVAPTDPLKSVADRVMDGYQADFPVVDDTIDIVGLADLAPGRPVEVVIHHANGSTDTINTTHTMSEEHIAWFRAGSALNVLRDQ